MQKLNLTIAAGCGVFVAMCCLLSASACDMKADAAEDAPTLKKSSREAAGAVAVAFLEAGIDGMTRLWGGGEQELADIYDAEFKDFCPSVISVHCERDCVVVEVLVCSLPLTWDGADLKVLRFTERETQKGYRIVSIDSGLALELKAVRVESLSPRAKEVYEAQSSWRAAGPQGKIVDDFIFNVRNGKYDSAWAMIDEAPRGADCQRAVYEFMRLRQGADFKDVYVRIRREGEDGLWEVYGTALVYGDCEICEGIFVAQVGKRGGEWKIVGFEWIGFCPLRPPDGWRGWLGAGRTRVKLETSPTRFHRRSLFYEGEQRKTKEKRQDKPTGESKYPPAEPKPTGETRGATEK